ncbi:hypothetical protein FSP39_010213 [Pinctada imbricata]|uniref:WD repeat-containing protein 89 n=1 Tax=Pinctada imbricata TaxID=66713 RepID=A0AA88XIN0_PINIB|nr:hypothetical protein FSP39_010213 [Pinctada imbricata]
MAEDEQGEMGLSDVLRNLSLHEKSAISIKKVEDDYVLDIAVQPGLHEKSVISIKKVEDDYVLDIAVQPGHSLHEKSAISLKKVEDDYVLDIAVQPGLESDRCIAATSSDYSLRLYKQGTLANIGSLTGHSNVVTGFTFSSTDKNTLYSSSLDSCIKCWDLRTSKCAQQLEGPCKLHCEFSSLGANSNDFIVCAGTEKSKKDEDVHILFWDRRKGEFLGSYCESHEDDITQVCFHPSDPNKLATGSTDGLVCMFDISQDSEDDAILFTFNSDSSVSKVGWCGSEASNLYCTTHIDTLHVWDTDQVMFLLCNHLKKTGPICFTKSGMGLCTPVHTKIRT